MNLSSVFTSALKNSNWPIYYNGGSKKFLVGDYFVISGSKARPISKVVLTTCKGRPKLELVPIKGTLKTEVEDDNALAIHFKYQAKNKTRVFFMRFHFFKHDPAVFTFQDNLFDGDNGCENDCCECCYPSIQLIAYSYDGGDDGSQGGGGAHAQ